MRVKSKLNETKSTTHFYLKSDISSLSLLLLLLLIFRLSSIAVDSAVDMEPKIRRGDDARTPNASKYIRMNHLCAVANSTSGNVLSIGADDIWFDC